MTCRIWSTLLSRNNSTDSISAYFQKFQMESTGLPNISDNSCVLRLMRQIKIKLKKKIRNMLLYLQFCESCESLSLRCDGSEKMCNWRKERFSNWRLKDYRDFKKYVDQTQLKRKSVHWVLKRWKRKIEADFLLANSVTKLVHAFRNNRC